MTIPVKWVAIIAFLLGMLAATAILMFIGYTISMKQLRMRQPAAVTSSQPPTPAPAPFARAA